MGVFMDTCKKNYFFLIHLKGYSPNRYLVLDDQATLSEFHLAIQAAFELDNDHPYRFYKGILSTSRNWNGFPIIEHPTSSLCSLLKTRTLGELNLTPHSNLTYIYQPEYKWVFHITLVSATDYFGPHQPAQCLSQDNDSTEEPLLFTKIFSE